MCLWSEKSTKKKHLLGNQFVFFFSSELLHRESANRINRLIKRPKWTKMISIKWNVNTDRSVYSLFLVWMQTILCTICCIYHSYNMTWERASARTARIGIQVNVLFLLLKWSCLRSRVYRRSQLSDGFSLDNIINEMISSYTWIRSVMLNVRRAIQ